MPFNRDALLFASLVASLAYSVVAAGPSPTPSAPSAETVTAAQPDPPLPALDTVIERVRQNLRRDREIESRYAFRERGRDVKVSRLGKVTISDDREFEVYPWPEPGRTYRRLVAVNGIPLPAHRIRAADDAQREKVRRQTEARQREGPAERQRRERRQAERERAAAEEIEDAFRVYEPRIVGREQLDGRRTLVASLTPRPNAHVVSDVGKYMKRLPGRVWIDEGDFQYVRIEMEATDAVTVGFGFVARIHAGSRVIYTRRLLDGVWLPAEFRVEATGRMALVRSFQVATVTRYSDYVRFPAGTDSFSLTAPRGGPRWP